MLKNLKKLFLLLVKNNKSLVSIYVIYTIFKFVSPFLLAYGPAYIIELITQKQPYEKIILAVIILFVGIFILSGTTNFITTIVWKEFLSLRLKVINNFMKVFIKIPYAMTEDKKFLDKGDMALKYINNNNDSVEEIWKNMFFLPAIILSLLGYIYIFGKINIFIILVMIGHIFLSNYMKRLAQKHSEKKSAEISNLWRHLDQYNNVMTDYKKIKEIKLYSAKNIFLNEVRKNIQNKKQIKKFLENKYFASNIISGVGEYFINGVLYAYFGYLLFMKKITVGEFYAYITLSTTFKSSVGEFVDKIMFFKKMEFYTNNYFEVISYLPEKKPEHLPVENYLDENVDIEIEFKNVSFRYSENTPYILKNCNLVISNKEKIALIGENGAGKSTLIKLLLKFYEPTEGEILLNGTNINSFFTEDYHKIFSVVFQDVYIYAMTLLENIVMKIPNEEDKKRFELFKNEEIIKLFEDKPQKYDSELTRYISDEGIDISGGQQQQIAILRANYQNNRFLILDEPTAALDPIAEEKLYEKFDSFAKNKNVIFISHRMAACKLADVILFLENGQIEERGSHSELLNKNGKYAEFYYAQASMYSPKNEVNSNEQI